MTENDNRVLIRNARLVDPSNAGLDAGILYDVEVIEGRIARIGENLKSDGRVIDAGGRHLFPAFCDPHVHFRTPGQTDKEDLDSGCRAALAGGFTSVIQMPNTCPVVDSPDLVRELTRDHPIELRVMAAVTKGSCSKELNDLGPVVDAGAVGLSDDGQPVSDARFMRRALEFSALRGVPVASHCEDKSVGVQGSVRSGNVAEILDVSGWDPAREWAMVERDIALAEETGGHVHICHVSTARSVEAIRSAKSKGLNISAEVTPHHLTLTADAVLDIGANAKMNPPLGDPEDRDALVEALATGAIDCIATDHAPHTRKEKSQGLLRSPFGVIGLETSFAVCYTELVRSDRITLERLIDAMAIQPRRIFKLEGVALAEGSRADMVLVDLDREWTVDPEMFQSKGRNCPFAGRRVAGKVLWTMYRGILWKVDV